MCSTPICNGFRDNFLLDLKLLPLSTPSGNIRSHIKTYLTEFLYFYFIRIQFLSTSIKSLYVKGTYFGKCSSYFSLSLTKSQIISCNILHAFPSTTTLPLFGTLHRKQLAEIFFFFFLWIKQNKMNENKTKQKQKTKQTKNILVHLI